MPIDPSIALQVQPVKIANPLDQYAQIAQIQQAQNQGRLSDLAYQVHQRDMADDQATRAALQANPEGGQSYLNALAKSGNAKAYAAAQKADLDRQKSTAEIGHLGAQTAETQGKAVNQAFALHRDQINTVNDPQSAAEWVKSAFADPLTGPIVSRVGTMEQALSKIPTDPQAFQQWKMQAGLSANEYVKHTSVDANTAANNATSIKTTGMNNATSRANNAASVSAEMRGQDLRHQDANLDPMVLEQNAQLIAKGQMPAPSGFALRSPVAQRIMARVSEINPEFSAKDYGTGAKAEKDFATGKQGNSVRSFNVAISHLDTLGNLADALNNGDTQLVNKIANGAATQIGVPAPTNFNAAKKIVADEVVKAIVGSGGGVHDREEASATISAVNSPAQLRGVINTYKELMKGQLGGLRDQYTATTGKKDFDQKYLSQGAKAVSSGDNNSHPPEIKSLLEKYGAK